MRRLAAILAFGLWVLSPLDAVANGAKLVVRTGTELVSMELGVSRLTEALRAARAKGLFPAQGGTTLLQSTAKPAVGCSGDCPLDDVAKWVDAAAVHAAGETMPVAVHGKVHVNGPVVSIVEYGDRTRLRGSVANLLVRFPDATVEVYGSRRFENGGSTVEWEPHVRVRGVLRELDEPYEGATHQLLSNQRMVFVNAATSGVVDGWFVVRAAQGRSLEALPVP